MDFWKFASSSVSLTSGAFESGAEPWGVRTPTQMHHQHPAMWFICSFFLPCPSAAQPSVHRAPGFILHTYSLFYASGLFVSLLSSATASLKQIQTHRETSLLSLFHSILLGLQDPCSGIKVMKLCWPKGIFISALKYFPLGSAPGSVGLKWIIPYFHFFQFWRLQRYLQEAIPSVTIWFWKGADAAAVLWARKALLGVVFVEFGLFCCEMSMGERRQSPPALTMPFPLKEGSSCGDIPSPWTGQSPRWRWMRTPCPQWKSSMWGTSCSQPPRRP